MNGSGLRIRSLDGLRALSVALVLFGHLAGTRGFPLAASSATSFGAMLGVRVFFVISGYLITRALLAEEEARNKSQNGKNYGRSSIVFF